MTEEKTTTKKAPAARKTRTSAAPADAVSAVDVPAKTAATTKAATTSAEKKPAAKKTAVAATPEGEVPPPVRARRRPPEPAIEAPVAEEPVLAAAAPVAEAIEEPALTASEAPADSASAAPSAEERYRMIESAAYFIAEKDGFQGCATHYWSLAEQQIAIQLGEAEA